MVLVASLLGGNHPRAGGTELEDQTQAFQVAFMCLVCLSDSLDSGNFFQLCPLYLWYSFSQDPFQSRTTVLKQELNSGNSKILVCPDVGAGKLLSQHWPELLAIKSLICGVNWLLERVFILPTFSIQVSSRSFTETVVVVNSVPSWRETGNHQQQLE